MPLGRCRLCEKPLVRRFIRSAIRPIGHQRERSARMCSRNRPASRPRTGHCPFQSARSPWRLDRRPQAQLIVGEHGHASHSSRSVAPTSLRPRACLPVGHPRAPLVCAHGIDHSRLSRGGPLGRAVLRQRRCEGRSGRYVPRISPQGHRHRQRERGMTSLRPCSPLVAWLFHEGQRAGESSRPSIHLPGGFTYQGRSSSSTCGAAGRLLCPEDAPTGSRVS